MLSDTKIKNLKPDIKRYRIADADGLYLDVPPTGKKHWLFRYTKDGKRKWLSIGEFPMIGLREARELRDQKRRMLFDGVPLESKPCTVEEEMKEVHKFQDVALEWVEKNTHTWSEDYKIIILRRLEMHVSPLIGNMDIKTLRPKDLLRIVHRLEETNALETSHRVISICSRIFRYAVAREYCDSDPTYSLRGALAAVKPKRMASLTDPRDVAILMRNIDAYPQPVVRLAMQFSALTFCRPGEIRQAEWSEVDMGSEEWRIPKEKMKMRRPHIVPLARQTLDLLQKLQPITGHGRYLFPNGRAPKGDRPMSENGVLVALRAMGYTKDQMVPHGFRSMASTLLNENGFNRDWIERQLAHVEGNSVRAAYNYAEYLSERREMMQWWADYLDELREKE